MFWLKVVNVTLWHPFARLTNDSALIRIGIVLTSSYRFGVLHLILGVLCCDYWF